MTPSKNQPMADSLSKYVSTPTKLLAIVMCLPLIDGVFTAIIISDGLNSPLDAIEVGILLLGGSAALTVILTEFEGPIRTDIIRVLSIGLIMLPLAISQAVLAPMIESFLNTEIFTRFAAFVLITVGARHISSKLKRKFPNPGTIIFLGLLASVENTPVQYQITTDIELIFYSIIASITGILFAIISVILREKLVSFIHIEIFRIGGGFSLFVLGISILGFIPTNMALLTLFMSFIVSIRTKYSYNYI